MTNIGPEIIPQSFDSDSNLTAQMPDEGGEGDFTVGVVLRAVVDFAFGVGVTTAGVAIRAASTAPIGVPVSDQDAASATLFRRKSP